MIRYSCGFVSDSKVETPGDSINNAGAVRCLCPDGFVEVEKPERLRLINSTRVKLGPLCEYTSPSPIPPAPSGPKIRLVPGARSCHVQARIQSQWLSGSLGLNEELRTNPRNFAWHAVEI